MTPAIEFVGTRKKALPKELKFTLFIGVANLVSRLHASSRCAGMEIEKVFVGGAQNLNDALMAGSIG